MSKPVYRQSQIYNFFDCPYKFILSREHDMPSTGAMDDGRLFEAMVLGAKSEQEMDELIGRKRKSTLEIYESFISHVKPIFGEGIAYKKMQSDEGEWILQGEADFIGTVTLYGKTYRTIADLKFTGSISKIWAEKDQPKDFLQAPIYQYLWFRLTGELLPFTYIVVENKKDFPTNAAPYIKVHILMPSENGIKWAINTIQKIHDLKNFQPNFNSCETGYYKSQCKFLPYCKHGRSVLERPVEIDFDDLFKNTFYEGV